MDDRTPVLVGLGEATRRASDPELTSVPAFIAHALRGAAADAYGAPAPEWNAPVGGQPAALLQAVELIAVAPSASWPSQAPGLPIAEELGITAATMRSSMVGGNGSQLLVNEVATRIQAGEVDVALVCGGEALHSQRTPFEDFGAMAMTAPDGSTEVLEADHPGNSEAEIEVGLMVPVLGYALMEQAIGRSAGRSISEQRQVAAELWSSFSRVAADHPNAWIRDARTADEISTATADNRQVSWPYTKLMVANLRIDEAAGLVMCSAAAARRLGIDESRWVYVHAGAQANDEWFLSERTDLDRSPAIAACGEALFARAGITGAELGPVDLYSCFPSAVAIAARELGLPVGDPGRPLTCTGGLTFFGGPATTSARTAWWAWRARCARRPRARSASAARWAGTRPSTRSGSTATPRRRSRTRRCAPRPPRRGARSLRRRTLRRPMGPRWRSPRRSSAATATRSSASSSRCCRMAAVRSAAPLILSCSRWCARTTSSGDPSGWRRIAR